MEQLQIFVAKFGNDVGTGSTRTHVELYITAGDYYPAPTTETDTSIEVAFDCFGMYYSIQPTLSSNSTATTSLAITGQSTQTITKTGSQCFNADISKKIVFSKTHATQKVTVKGSFAFSNFKDANGNTFSGTSTATGTFNIPPKTSYQITLDLNGGTGAATSATKWHGENLVFPAPTKDGYALAGWTDGTQTYDSEHPYTANAAATLTAVWAPTISAIYITDLTAKRATNTGVPADDGTHVLIEPAWRVEGAATGNITVAATMDSTPVYSDSETVAKSSTANVDSSDLVNPPSFLASGANTNERYTITVTVSCGGKTATRSVILPTAYFVMDVKAGGHGIAFGKPAETDYLFEVDNMNARFGQDLSVDGDLSISGDASITGAVSIGEIDYIECRLSANTAAGTTATWTYVDVKLDTEAVKHGDALSLATSGTNRYGVVVAKDGWYRLSGWLNMNATGYGAITVNNSTVNNIVIITTGYAGAGFGSSVRKLTAGDVVKIRVERTGSTDPKIAGATLTALTVERIG